jgi:hypothetical protein
LIETFGNLVNFASQKSLFQNQGHHYIVFLWINQHPLGKNQQRAGQQGVLFAWQDLKN